MRVGKINIIVFSKDRAMQLDLFLRSFMMHVVESPIYQINVLYSYSNNDFKKGYDKLIDGGFSNVSYLLETEFKRNLLSMIYVSYPLLVFFVDDNIFLRAFDFYDSQMLIMDRDDVLCRSLRLNPHMEHCYPAQKNMTPPSMDKDNVWTWVGASVDYGYPMSVDGHIFRTHDLYPLLVSLNYSNPNTLEGSLVTHSIKDRPKMVCYDKSVIVNNPINRVQTVNGNRHGTIDQRILNNKWLDGYRISLNPFINFDNTSCHQEIDLIYEGGGN